MSKGNFKPIKADFSSFEQVAFVEVALTGEIEKGTTRFRADLLLHFCSTENETELKALLENTDGSTYENQQKKRAMRVLIEQSKLDIALLFRAGFENKERSGTSENKAELHPASAPSFIGKEKVASGHTVREYRFSYESTTDNFSHSKKTYGVLQKTWYYQNATSLQAIWETTRMNELRLIYRYDAVPFNPNKMLIDSIFASEAINDAHFAKAYQLTISIPTLRQLFSPAKSSRLNRVHSYWLYGGLAFLFFTYFLDQQQRTVPLFDSNLSAYSWGLMATALGVCQLSFWYKNRLVAYGVGATSLGTLAWWRDWDIPLLHSYEPLLVLGILLLVLGLFPALIGVPMVVGGTFFLCNLLYRVSNYGFSSVPLANWLIVIVSIVVGLWLNKYHEHLNTQGRFRKS